MINLTAQNQAAERENDEKQGITTSDISSSFSKVQSGLDFILSHFSEPLFPRKVSTAATDKRQHQVVDKDRTMLYYQGALWEDCRIAAFSIGQENPDHL